MIIWQFNQITLSALKHEFKAKSPEMIGVIPQITLEKYNC